MIPQTFINISIQLVSDALSIGMSLKKIEKKTFVGISITSWTVIVVKVWAGHEKPVKHRFLKIKINVTLYLNIFNNPPKLNNKGC